jgi:peptidoglycan/xylan/chitin deacetylase (PgdA/CDA1 family)
MTALHQILLSRPLVRQQLKKGAFVGMGLAGLICGWGQNRQWIVDSRGGLRVLMYHRVSRRRIDTYTISPRRLERHLALLRSRYTVVSPGEVLRSIESRSPLPDRAVLLTFDDAYLEYYENAYPLLSDMGLQALLFVPTDYIGERGSKTKGAHRDGSLDWAHLSEMQDVFAIGSHGMSHQMLTRLPRVTAALEIVESKRLIEDRLGRSVSFFSYPYGTLEAYNLELEGMIRAAGYKASFATIGGRNSLEAVWSGGALHRYGSESLSEFGLARVLDGSCEPVLDAYTRYRQRAILRR